MNIQISIVDLDLLKFGISNINKYNKIKKFYESLQRYNNLEFSVILKNNDLDRFYKMNYIMNKYIYTLYLRFRAQPASPSCDIPSISDCPSRSGTWALNDAPNARAVEQTANLLLCCFLLLNLAKKISKC